MSGHDPQNHAYFCRDECWNVARSEQELRDRLRQRSASLGASRFSAGSEDAEYRLAEETRRRPGGARSITGRRTPPYLGTPDPLDVRWVEEDDSGKSCL